MISARDVTVRYGGRVAVDGVCLEARPGEVLAILGANGSGKTSLLRALAGVQACGGTVVHGAASVGYMPQDNAVRAALTAFEVVLLGRLRSLTLRVGEGDLEAARAALAELGIVDLAARAIGELSGGQRQLVFMAQVLAADPAILLLDEPTSALDIAHQLHVLDLLRTTTIRRGLTTVAVLHDLNAAARFSDRMALMAGGRLLCAGTAASVLTEAVLREAYGVEVCVMAAPDGRPVVIPLRADSFKAGHSGR
ncbi:MAG: ABC transporter ATP-binding protein [Janthinobacterium lividum]